jgi:hypothetical protein
MTCAIVIALFTKGHIHPKKESDDMFLSLSFLCTIEIFFKEDDELHVYCCLLYVDMDTRNMMMTIVACCCLVSLENLFFLNGKDDKLCVCQVVFFTRWPKVVDQNLVTTLHIVAFAL